MEWDNMILITPQHNGMAQHILCPLQLRPVNVSFRFFSGALYVTHPMPTHDALSLEPLALLLHNNEGYIARGILFRLPLVSQVRERRIRRRRLPPPLENSFARASPLAYDGQPPRYQREIIIC